MRFTHWKPVEEAVTNKKTLKLASGLSDPRVPDGENRRRFLRRVWGAAAVLGGGAAATAAWFLSRSGAARRNDPRVIRSLEEEGQTYEVVHSYPHDREAFTQGLAFEDGILYEGTGIEGKSSLRQVDLATGRVVRRVDLDPAFFGEGIAVVGDQIVQLTWQNGVGIVYDRATFRERQRFRYGGEGWGLTYDGTHLILSDGTESLFFLDPRTFAFVRRVKVGTKDGPLKALNELEYVEGEIYANVWHKDFIARIDPQTGAVLGSINLAGLYPEGEGRGREDVLNGIAYDRTARRLFVTGKNWPRLFQIRVASAKH